MCNLGFKRLTRRLQSDAQKNRAPLKSSVRCITVDVLRHALYSRPMIKSFADAETERVFRREFSKKLPGDIQSVALRKLHMLNNAHAVNDLRIPPANRLEKLTGNRQGRHSIRINDQWHVCFVWQDGDAYDVEIVDYH